jgi:thioredoxin-like negative regulator of GroEL
MYRKIKELGNQAKPSNNFEVIEIENVEHKTQLLQQNLIVCVNLHANWCQPCKYISPDYSSMAYRKNSPGNLLLVKENIDKKLSGVYNITAVPTFLIFVKGRMHTKIIGPDLEKLELKIKNIIDENSGQPHPVTNPNFESNSQFLPGQSGPSFNPYNRNKNI